MTPVRTALFYAGIISGSLLQNVALAEPVQSKKPMRQVYFTGAKSGHSSFFVSLKARLDLIESQLRDTGRDRVPADWHHSRGSVTSQILASSPTKLHATNTVLTATQAPISAMKISGSTIKTFALVCTGLVAFAWAFAGARVFKVAVEASKKHAWEAEAERKRIAELSEKIRSQLDIEDVLVLSSSGSHHEMGRTCGNKRVAAKIQKDGYRVNDPVERGEMRFDPGQLNSGAEAMLPSVMSARAARGVDRAYGDLWNLVHLQKHPHLNEYQHNAGAPPKPSHTTEANYIARGSHSKRLLPEDTAQRKMLAAAQQEAEPTEHGVFDDVLSFANARGIKILGHQINI